MSCNEATINVDWQFNVNTWEGNSGPSEAPHAGLNTFGRYRHYDLATQRMVKNYPEADRDAIEDLAYGQRHNPHAQQTYRACAAQHGIYAFFRRVVSAAPGRQANFNEARININWQIGANPSSVNSARDYWLSAQNVSNAEAKNYFMVRAMDELMFGQHHNGGVMQLYRACFRDNPTRLFNMVRNIELRTSEEIQREIINARMASKRGRKRT